MARMVATKAALSIRVDALTDSDGKSDSSAPSIGLENRAKLESRLRALEYTGDLAGANRFAEGGKKQQRFEMKGDVKTYNTQADAVDLVSTQREDPMEIAVKAVLDVKEEKRKAKEERRAKKKAEKEKAAAQDGSDVEMDGDVKEDKKDKKDKKRKRRESEANGVAEEAKPKVSTYLPSSPCLSLMDCHRQEETEEERKARKKARKAEKEAAMQVDGDSPKKKKKKSA